MEKPAIKASILLFGEGAVRAGAGPLEGELRGGVEGVVRGERALPHARDRARPGTAAEFINPPPAPRHIARGSSSSSAAASTGPPARFHGSGIDAA